MTHRIHVIFMSLFVTNVAACGMDVAGVGDDRSPASVRERLATPEALPLQPAASVVTVDGARFQVQHGELSIGVDPDGSLRLDALDLALPDVTVTLPQLPDPGLRLVGVRVSLPEPVAGATTWSFEEDWATADVTAELRLDWSVVTPGGRLIDLAPQRVADVPLDLDVYVDQDGRLTAAVFGVRPGVFWSWAGLFEMSDLELELRAIQ